MSVIRPLVAVLAGLAALAAAPAGAADIEQGVPEDAAVIHLVDEIRAGLIFTDLAGDDAGAAGSLELFSAPLGDEGTTVFSRLLAPRLGVGGVIGDSISYAFAGLAWRFPLIGALELDLGAGAAINDGGLDLGCRVTFREYAGLAYAATDHLKIAVGVEHLSHAGLCGDDNPGLTNAGLRIGYVF